ncbi:hypothetical protein J2Z75_005024 [Rhizobium herbae]|uniref:Uncharacterized protein n=1 Tax=Rhizobium herbae TaxID=508661 RepID=A0ABS4EU64_9HYPH|nr:hypothetical protein [Rhizobium herbae]
MTVRKRTMLGVVHVTATPQVGARVGGAGIRAIHKAADPTSATTKLSIRMATPNWPWQGDG